MRSLLLVFVLALVGAACNDRPVAADTVGVGADCSATKPCQSYPTDGGGTAPLTCLTQFTGGYCGIQGCGSSLDCPSGSICVHHTDGNDYCFRACAQKSDCNVNRTTADEANCSSSFTWAVPTDDNGSKACIPPSSGI